MPFVVVIGAGVAGIAAAVSLIEKRITQVLVLEASGRVGGRIKSHLFDGDKESVELGAQWVIGQDNNIVYDLCKGDKCLDHADDTFSNAALTLSNGEQVPTEASEKLRSMLESINVGKTDRLANFDGALGNYLQEEFQREIDKAELDSALASQFFQMYEKYNCGINYFNTTLDVSANGVLNQWKCKGDRFNYFKAPGYEQILNLLSKKSQISLEGKIFLHKTVVGVDYLEQEPGKVMIKCSDGTTFNADHVIVTLPLGVLKRRHDKIFTPPLPQKKVNAIQGFGVGSSNKLILKFKEPFWSETWQGVNCLWCKCDLNKVKRSKYHWIRGISGLYPAPGRKDTLYAVNHGKHSILMELTQEEDLRKGVRYLLKHFLNQKVEPQVILKSTWYTDENFHGSHSYNSISAELLEAVREDLASPIISSIGSPLVLFAGEATHSHYFSTVHGAIETGWREVDRLINYYNLPNAFIPRSRFTSTRIEKSVDVLILGAGAAGIAAARKFKKSKLTFLVLEADERPGGRLHSCYLNNIDPSLKENVRIDAGGQWIYDRNSPLYHFAKEKGLLIFDKSKSENGIFVREDGVPIDLEFADEVERLVKDILENCTTFKQQEDDYPKNLDEYLTTEFEKKLSHKDPVVQMQARQLLDWNKRVIAADYAAPDLTKISAKQWRNAGGFGTRREHISIRDGLGNLMALMAYEVGSEYFLFHKLVQKIHWGTDLILNVGETKKILIKCSDGSLYAANHVIVTFSLGVLKHDSDQMFIPKLPEVHQEAIKKAGFGPLTKIFVQFDNSWLKNEAGGQLVFREEDYTGASWIRYLTGFERLLSGHVENTFQGWVIGQGAVEVEKLSDSQVHKDMIAMFLQFLGSSPPYPKRYFISHWNGNPLTRGAFSYPAAECDEDEIGHEQLSEPIGVRHLHDVFNFKDRQKKNIKLLKRNFDYRNPILMFAGEACHSQHTAHGAYLSGESQAKRILEYKRRSQSDRLEEVCDIVDSLDLIQVKEINMVDMFEELMEII